MSIATDIQSLSPSAIIELFELDTSAFVGGGIIRFHAGTNQLLANVVWQGNTYIALPVEADGFAKVTKGTLPRPRLRIVNIDGVFSALVRENGDLVGCKLTRKRTFAKYLDAVNFTAGNSSADTSQHLDDELWFVDSKVSENRFTIEWELASAFDVQNVKLPYRLVIQNSCPWQYKGEGCGYTGTLYFDANDSSTTLLNDVCGKRLTSCRVRFPGGSPLPFGGFPGATRNAL